LKIQDLYKEKNKFLPDDELQILFEIEYQINETNTDSADLLPFTSNTKGYLIAHFQQLFNTKSLADVIVDVQGQKFDVHKLILCARSPVFFAMFENDFTEKKTNTFEVEDIAPEVFLEVLRFIYTDKVEKLDEMAPQLLAAADKYMLDLLKTKCEIALARNVTLENCGQLLILAHLHCAKDLKKILLDFVRCYSSEVAVTSNWLTLLETASPQLLRDISMTLMNASH
jgi:speckle-type POZ protein